ncbi:MULTISPECIES: hypothetical protein [Rhizobium]|uniref:hypothetical protein n=1 Tax=Rhizobium TaxID=379 RepID=UPI0016221915|nr:hypothetical protein [Rhizobium leucaenae]MBB6305013.1 hypothetical protein [Rhizobium leucaenae]
MSNDINKRAPDLRTTPVRRQPWMPWVVILGIIVVAALAWAFWPHTSTTNPNAPAQTTTTQPTTTTPPATTPAQQ